VRVELYISQDLAGSSYYYYYFFFTSRVEKVLYEIQRRSPIMTDAEKQMGQQLRLLESKVNTLRQAIESLRRKEQLLGDKV
jgi:hypothetical protein